MKNKNWVISNIILCIVCTLLLIGCGTTKIVVIKNFDFEKYKRLAVVPFYSVSEVYNSKLVTYMFISEFRRMKKRKYIIAEEAKLDNLLKELNFEHADYLDEESRREIGDLLNVDALIIGSIKEVWVSGEMFPHIHLSLQLVDVETGLVVWKGEKKTSVLCAAQSTERAARGAIRGLIKRFP